MFELTRQVATGRNRFAVRVLVVVAVVAAVLAIDSGAAESATTVRRLKPRADAYVESTSPSTKFGTSTKLISDASPAREVFLRFDLTTIAAPVQSARLRIHVAHVTDGPSPRAKRSRSTRAVAATSP